MGSKHYMGFGNREYIGGGDAADYQESTKVLRGCMIQAPTNASTINTGTPIHDFNVNLEGGALAIDGVVENVAPAADVDVSSGSSAPVTSGQSIIYCLIYWLSKGDRKIRSKWVAGTAAAHATVQRPTKEQVETAIGSSDVMWICVGETRLKCTGATAVTQEYNNAVAPFDIPDQPIPILQG